MRIIWTVVIAAALIALFFVVDVPAIRRGEGARAANGGRPTRSARISIAAIAVLAVVLVAVKL